jgi:hypothetical protein
MPNVRRVMCPHFLCTLMDEAPIVRLISLKLDGGAETDVGEAQFYRTYVHESGIARIRKPLII